MKHADDVLDFWFGLTHTDWFQGSKELDAQIRDKFSATHDAVARGETFGWRATPEGRLAEVIVLDQFSRNIFRGSSQAFAYDGMALVLSQEAVAQKVDTKLEGPRRTFLYMPYMHSESLVVHEEAMRLFTVLGDENALKFERIHIDTIRRFGRYPRRNEALGRTSTAEELEYMKSGGQF
ncbi:MAG TPA: DUF924 family protein [Kofleriaceae bacterium]|nr:DUF924 family protein [Kofleriaceae bacterium]